MTRWQRFREFMGWHDGNGGGGMTFDGASLGSRCSMCGRRVLMDSQGNWFTVGERV